MSATTKEISTWALTSASNLLKNVLCLFKQICYQYCCTPVVLTYKKGIQKSSNKYVLKFNNRQKPNLALRSYQVHPIQRSSQCERKNKKQTALYHGSSLKFYKAINANIQVRVSECYCISRPMGSAGWEDTVKPG